MEDYRFSAFPSEILIYMSRRGETQNVNLGAHLSTNQIQFGDTILPNFELSASEMYLLILKNLIASAFRFWKSWSLRAVTPSGTVLICVVEYMAGK